MTATSGRGTAPVLPSWPRRSGRLGAAVVAELVDRVVSGELPHGSTLPNEPALCAAFGVSRTVIRESVKLLEEKGLVRVRQGQGTTVADYDDWNLLDPMVLEASVRHDEQLRLLDDLVDVRVVLESQMARQAANQSSAAERAELRRFLDQMADEVATPQVYVVTDVAFHDAIMRASGNRLARAVIRTIHAEARASVRYNGKPRRRDCEASHAGHVAIYEHIARGDGDGAAAAMSEHIRGSWLARRKRRPAASLIPGSGTQVAARPRKLPRPIDLARLGNSRAWGTRAPGELEPR